MAHASDPTVNPGDTELELPAKYSETSVEVLLPSSRAKLSKYLNVPGVLIEAHDGEVINDYNGLAEIAGHQGFEQRERNPTGEFLETWVKKDKVHSTIGNLWQYLREMQRLDVHTDCRPNVSVLLPSLQDHVVAALQQQGRHGTPQALVMLEDRNCVPHRSPPSTECMSLASESG